MFEIFFKKVSLRLCERKPNLLHGDRSDLYSFQVQTLGLYRGCKCSGYRRFALYRKWETISSSKVDRRSTFDTRNTMTVSYNRLDNRVALFRTKNGREKVFSSTKWWAWFYACNRGRNASTIGVLLYYFFSVSRDAVWFNL